MCRCATGTPMEAATACCEALLPFTLSDTKFLRIPLQPQLARRRHVADERRRRHHRRAGEIAFAAEAHAVLPIAVERRDRAFTGVQRVRALAEARTAPRSPDLAADRSEDARDRFTIETRIGALDLLGDAARPGKNHERLRRPRRALRPGAAD